MISYWPDSSKEFMSEICILVAYAMAHEGLEWLREDNIMPHDPHVDGEVTVIL
jgi:hypothetical protein